MYISQTLNGSWTQLFLLLMLQGFMHSRHGAAQTETQLLAGVHQLLISSFSAPDCFFITFREAWKWAILFDWTKYKSLFWMFWLPSIYYMEYCKVFMFKQRIVVLYPLQILWLTQNADFTSSAQVIISLLTGSASPCRCAWAAKHIITICTWPSISTWIRATIINVLTAVLTGEPGITKAFLPISYCIHIFTITSTRG